MNDDAGATVDVLRLGETGGNLSASDFRLAEDTSGRGVTGGDDIEMEEEGGREGIELKFVFALGFCGGGGGTRAEGTVAKGDAEELKEANGDAVEEKEVKGCAGKNPGQFD